MQAQYNRKINTSKQYDKYFGKADMLTTIVEEDADLKDTLKEIKRMVSQYYPQTTSISKILDKKDVYKTCQAIWNFVYQNIQYQLDADGKEQLRTPNRTWKDRFTGVDCDCYSLFISTILVNLGIKHKFRLAEYNKKGYFQHIYVVVPYQNSEIIIDCVKDNFNSEQNYTKKKDVEMNLEILSGLGNPWADADGKVEVADIDPSEFSDGDRITNPERYEVLSFKPFEESYKEELAYLNTLKLSPKEITALQNFMNELAGSKNLLKYEFTNGIIDATFIEALNELDLYKKEMQVVQPLREKRWFTKEWFKKNTFEIVVIGGASLLTLAFAVSFLGNGNNNPTQQPNKEKEVNGLAGTKKNKKRKNSNTLR